MTDKSAAAVREFIFQYLSSDDEWGYTFEKPGSVEALTALIEEHYVSKEDVNQEVEKRIAERMPSGDECNNESISYELMAAGMGGRDRNMSLHFVRGATWACSRLTNQKTEGGGE